MIFRFRQSSAAFRMVGIVTLLLSISGCINAAALIGKMVIGDPKANSKFETSTGVDLEEEGEGIILHCTAPLSIVDVAETLPRDVESDLIRRMKLKKMAIIDQNRVVEAIDSHGGRFNTQVLMHEIPDAKYLFEIMIERYELREPRTPHMYHGRCTGRIVGYEFEGDPHEGQDRRMAQVFEHEFDIDYPNEHPVPVDQMSESSFRKKFISELTLRLGNMFYDVTSKELF